MPRPFLKFTNQTLLEKYMAVITAAMVKELRVKTDADDGMQEGLDRSRW